MTKGLPHAAIFEILAMIFLSVYTYIPFQEGRLKNIGKWRMNREEAQGAENQEAEQ